MVNRIWLGLMIIGVSGLLASCGGRSAQAPSQTETTQPVAGATAPASSTTTRPNLTPADSTTLRSTTAVTGNLPNELLRSRGTAATPPIASGKIDPFVSVADQAVVIPSPTIPTRQEEVLPKPTALPAAPPAPAVVSTVPLAAPPPPPLSALQPVPAVNVPAAPTAPPPPLMAERIQISGLVHVGDRLSLIAEIPGEATSRTATVGDYLAGGQVLVKRVDSSGPEPVVVLEENGREIIRTIGSSAAEIGML